MQLAKIASRDSPMAGSTGASVSSELPMQTDEQPQSSAHEDDVYSIRFINHAAEPIHLPSVHQYDRIIPWVWLKEELWQEGGLLARSKGDNDLLLQPTSNKWHQGRS